MTIAGIFRREAEAVTTSAVVNRIDFIGRADADAILQRERQRDGPEEREKRHKKEGMEEREMGIERKRMRRRKRNAGKYYELLHSSWENKLLK